MFCVTYIIGVIILLVFVFYPFYIFYEDEQKEIRNLTSHTLKKILSLSPSSLPSPLC